ncbi:hypothetical protein AXF42_Ash018343 [Apostasia shenzhenica]|uniref:C2 NT-type domain-containing protein n=1 Tax=Apostasia shenzhenica TaxID=1088818 RepID=A0A2H9ZR78_9ASPA|nr:hypothetical protein AXF42_Ash018343 [Apostasia shenzhenica]
MVSRIIRWPWPAIVAKNFEVRLVVRSIEGIPAAAAGGRLTAVVKWKGPKQTALSSLRRSGRRNCTREEVVRGEKGEVEWNEEFWSIVVLTAQNQTSFNPWTIKIAVFHEEQKSKAAVIGVASLNLSEYASAAGEELELHLPSSLPGDNVQSRPVIHLSLRLSELTTCPQSPGMLQRPVVPNSPFPASVGSSMPEKDEVSALKAGLKKVRKLTDFVSSKKSRGAFFDDEGSDSRHIAKREGDAHAFPFDTDSFDDDPNEEIEDCDDDTRMRKSFSYGSLSVLNHIGGAFFCSMRMNEDYEDWIYYSNGRSDVGSSHVDETTPSTSEHSIIEITKRSFLPWKKRKYTFRSRKSKGEPLLNKANGEEGGDDIDYDRRLLSSSDESVCERANTKDDESVHNSSVSDFGEDNFAVGTWESREIISRDGLMKLCTQVFFASIDQRSEQAAGESACTALVAVIADWFHSNQERMPIKSQFDSLIREGSIEWRNLCKIPTYRERFPDKHFDLETVLQAKIRPLTVLCEKSFIGFFNPENSEDIEGFEFLHGAMSFDSIWQEITQLGSEGLYIVSWNDHFFVLKVEKDACYIVDTLGERLYEGCHQAYILKFDYSTIIHRIPSINSNSGSSGEPEESRHTTTAEDEVVCAGKDSCKEYIKSFLAAIPIRELQNDMKKGILASNLLHHRRLQIEFHFTDSPKKLVNFVAFSPPTSLVSATQIPSPTEESSEAGKTKKPAAAVEVVY